MLFLVRWFFYPDDRGDKFLRNVGSYNYYVLTACVLPSSVSFHSDDGADMFLQNVSSYKS
jgi:hypothetical protein